MKCIISKKKVMTKAPNVYDEMARLMAAGMKTEELIAYEIPASFTERYEVLVAKEKEGHIREEEKHELDALLMVNHIISMAKLMAMKNLEAA